MRCLYLLCLLLLNTAYAASDPDAMWTYKSVDGKDLQMSVFLPADYESGNQFSTFVVFHGGSWNAGDASWHYPDCRYWARRGMIAASVDYRLRDRDKIAVPLECVKDAKSAIRYLRKNATALKVDTDRIVVAGGGIGQLGWMQEGETLLNYRHCGKALGVFMDGHVSLIEPGTLK
ncbi:MAG: acetyl esterase/lipase [Candidatus Promineifilaceae bacterium]|jgi:acetyl esterase/lipase